MSQGRSSNPEVLIPDLTVSYSNDGETPSGFEKG